MRACCRPLVLVLVIVLVIVLAVVLVIVLVVILAIVIVIAYRHTSQIPSILSIPSIQSMNSHSLG